MLSVHEVSIAEAKKYIDDNFTEKIHISTLAKMCYTSVRHFNRIFRAATNTSPQTYAMKCRIQHAIQLLRSSSASIDEVATTAGFSSRTNMYQQFHRYLNKRPSYFRMEQYDLNCPNLMQKMAGSMTISGI